MDSLTQVVLGAAVGYAVASKHMGKKALLWGAFAGLLPDLDILPLAPFEDELLYLNHHRGFSHSLAFAIFGPLGIYGALKGLKKRWPNLNLAYAKRISWLFFWGISTHILLDCFTSWGTQVFWPHPYRMAFSSVFIIDPLYTIPLIISLVVAAFLTQHATRKKWVISALTISTLYLGWGLCAKAVVNHQFRTIFAAQEKEVIRFTSRPTAFNSILWS
ncbi:MAG: metal-dependent hydrolase, partial [bacterium]|nr:metal-dependent hydrolase [bacterium]